MFALGFFHVAVSNEWKLSLEIVGWKHGRERESHFALN
jgi:hypothetical protein